MSFLLLVPCLLFPNYFRKWSPGRHAKISSQMSHVTFFVCGTDVPSSASRFTIFNSDQFQWYFLFFLNLVLFGLRKNLLIGFLHSLIYCLHFHKLVIISLYGCGIHAVNSNFSLNLCGFFSYLTCINEFSSMLSLLDDTPAGAVICKHMQS